MTVVPATLEHLPWLRRLFAGLVAEGEQHHGGTYPSHDAEELDNFTLVCAQRIGQQQDFLCWVALDDGTGLPVGFLAGEIGQRAIGKPHVFAAPHWLYVDTDHRGQGAARALVAAGTEHLRALGISHVELAALAADHQWQDRGWAPYLTRYVLPLLAVDAALDAKHAPLSPVDPTATVVVAPAGHVPKKNGHAPHMEP